MLHLTLQNSDKKSQLGDLNNATLTQQEMKTTIHMLSPTWRRRRPGRAQRLALRPAPSA